MTFAHPFLAILAAAAFFASVIFSAMAMRRKKAALSEFADAKILPKLSRNISQVKIYLKAALFAAGLALAVLALARPQWGYKWEEVKQMGVDIIFAVDTSKSMMAEDIKPNRLERAKLAISDVIERLDGDRIGLVAFSGQAFLQCPITLDYDAFKMSLDALDTNIIQRGGTNIAAAIDEAQSAFSSSKNQKILVLISDGEELEQSGIARAERAAKEIGMKIYTLGVGSASGEPIPVRGQYGKTEFLKDASGNMVKSMLNEDLLKKVAAATGGIYANLSDDGMDAIYEEGLKKAPKAEISARMKKLAIERFQIPLAIALLLLALEFCLGTRRIFGGKGSALAIALLALPAFFAPEKAFAGDNKTPLPEAASPAPQQQASAQKRQAPEPKSWQEFFNAGVDALEKKDAPAAQENFIKAIAHSHNDMQAHAKSYYNMGCLDYELAKSAFEKSGLNLQGLDQAIEASHAALLSSSQTIKKGQDTLKNSGEEALKEQNLQNEIKGEISKCEQSKKSLQEAEKTSEQAVSKLKAISAQTLASQKNFANAAELDPEMQSASRNLEAAQNAIKNIAKIGAQTHAAGEKIAANIKALDFNIEELKKLLRDDNQQNNQDNKQQNQQDNKDNQNQQQSQQDNKQQNNQQDQSQQSQQQQNQDSQQNNQNNQQNQQQNQQDNKQQNNQQNSQKDNQNQQENKDQQDNKDKNQDAGESGNDGAQKESSAADKPEAKEDLQNEQAANSQNAQDGKDAKEENAASEEKSSAKEDEAAAMQEAAAAQEAAAKQAEERQAASAEKADDENSPDYRAQTGVMTRREASQVLDSMKEGEKKLPFSGYGSQRSRFEDKKYKDW
ncbi:MAG: VWA domain-containing protein [Opitutales bacterium]|nr:VWA domain-containing protein [Opitutales bacterium]